MTIKEKLREYNDNLFRYIKANNSLHSVLYLDLGVKKVRLLCYSEQFIPHIFNQLDVSLSSQTDKYDATIVLWNENNPENLKKHLSDEFNPKINLHLRVEMLVLKLNNSDFSVFDDSFSVSKPVLSIDTRNNLVNSYDRENETYFYGVKDLGTEEFIKHGHIFVQILNNILKTENSNLIHGACIGLNNKGVLLCARGQRGKSTLSVLSMLEGFEYVSDDYLTIEKTQDGLFAYPIYSIITLSPEMYNKLSDKLDLARYVSLNARKDKYVINISLFKDRFKTKYPVKFCMFPEFVSDSEPSIVKCSQEEKGKAIVQLIHSTISQMNDVNDIKTIQKIISMVKYFRFYKFNLSSDIFKNVECLKKFFKEY